MKVNQDITIVINTYNEANQIREVISNAKQLTANIVVVDMKSTDATVSLAEKAGVNVISIPHTMYVEPARNKTIESVRTDWVFILDADERLTNELIHEIKSSIKSERYSYYKVPRKNIFAQKYWLSHGGWWPDTVIRLINKKYFIEWPADIHSTPIIKGDCGVLTHPLLHYFHGVITKMVEKTIIYENIESELLYGADKNVQAATFFRKYFGELLRRLILKKGFLDGSVGVIESIYQAYSKTITYLFLYEKKHCKLSSSRMRGSI
jgi:glycosyltransferase involved in cell wall biosynthesis